jgi:hypothetical protein
MTANFTARDIVPEFTYRPFILAYIASNLEGCEHLNESAGNTTVFLSPQLKGVYVSIAILSMVCSLFVALTIFYNPKLRIHPSKLICYMCICEGISCFNALVWAIGPLDIICYFGLHYAYKWTIFTP